MSEAGPSAIDRIRAFEQHLKKYPDSKQRALIEKELVKSATETNDNARIILYGEKVFQRESPPDQSDVMQMLDRVTRALVDKNDPEQAKRAIGYAKRYEGDVAALRAKMEPPGHLTPAQWSEELDKAMARALALEARATGNAGDPEAARKIAAKSWETYPTGEGARETAFWLASWDIKPRPSNIMPMRLRWKIRAQPKPIAPGTARGLEGFIGAERVGEGSGRCDSPGLRPHSALLNARRANLKAKDPNSDATGIEDFTLPAVDKTAPPLVLSALKGKDGGDGFLGNVVCPVPRTAAFAGKAGDAI